MIKMKNAVKHYDGFKLNCTFEVPAGSVVGLVGRNGMGKSTTFKSILNITTLDSGEIELMGKDINTLTPKDKESIGVVFADSGFSGYLCVKDLSPILRGFYTTFDEIRFAELVKKMGLPLKKQIKSFSTGMKAKLKVAVALSHDAKLLILDEPTAGLDVIVRNELIDLLREYMEESDDNTILISSHISKDLEGICDYLCFINDGEIILTEDMDTLLDSYAILKVTEDEYSKLDKEHLLYAKKEDYGYSCLTNQRQFFVENYPNIVIEKNSIDDLIVIMLGGQKL
ncbi:MAG: ABC transporter ATP-binding protein [Suipraeoptans sp.]